uniref:Uncharacterized protein n=1 Tax=Panagrolaimus sp. ES5 TaxID=591445 RepID=A0AC34FX36_9BILA
MPFIEYYAFSTNTGEESLQTILHFKKKKNNKKTIAAYIKSRLERDTINQLNIYQCISGLKEKRQSSGCHLD